MSCDGLSLSQYSLTANNDISGEDITKAVENLKSKGINFIALDFDLTLTSVDSSKWRDIASWEYDQKVEHASQGVRPVFKMLMPMLVSHDIFVAIVSFCEHQGFIKSVLEKCFGPDAENIPIRDNQIRNHIWEYRGVAKAEGKLHHMASAAEFIQATKEVKITRATTLLIDDNKSNVEISLANNVRALRFYPNQPNKILANIIDDL